MSKTVKLGVEGRRLGGMEMSEAVRKFMDTARERVISKLVDAAISALHHDATDGGSVDLYERHVLRGKFTEIMKSEGY